MAKFCAQTTSSTSTSTCIYHVFLSFRGPDTRKSFTDHLFTTLIRAGVRTFRDEDEIETGEKNKLELERAIKSSKMSIIIFSETYASSKACLQEVATILEHSKRSRHQFLPVFYRVEPAYIKDQALKGLPDVSATKENKKRWSMALKEVASVFGMHLKHQHESKFIEEIVKLVTQKTIRKVLAISQHLIGIESRVNKIKSWLKGETAEKILVLCGMGGSGKTTAAKYIYNSHYDNFDASTFLENIRETSGLPKGLIGLQRQLLSEISGREKEKIYTVDSGTTRIECVLGNKNVLLVLDDVDEEKQLHTLLGRGNMTTGSKIIITTRHEDLLKDSENCVKHKIENLDDHESLELFRRHAFGRVSSCDGFLEHSRKLVRYCEGLPLALEVLGSSFSKTRLDDWVTLLDKLYTMPDNNITETLKISYDSLESDHDRNLFLDIAYFFIGVKKNKVVEILDGCNYCTKYGIQRLVNRNLLTVENDKLGMHQWLQHMGRQIVLKESKHPERRSRIWSTKECFNILRDKTGSENIEGLIFDMDVLRKDTFAPENSYWTSTNDEVLKTDGFTNMRNLRLLKLCYIPISGAYKEFPKYVRWLYWRGILLRSLPNDFPLENIVYLDLPYSNLEQVWTETKVLQSLKVLNLSHSPKLTKTPNFSGMPNLEKLLLKDCQSLVKVDESVANLQRLTVLNLKNCKSLRKLPRSIVKIRSLRELIFSGCSNLELPEALWDTVESLGTNPINLSGNLLTLSLMNMNLSDDAFPKNLGNAPVRHLSLGGNPMHSLPNFIKDFRSLQTLDLSGCTRLEQILWPSISLEELTVTWCSSLKQIKYETWVRPQCINHGDCVNLNYIEGGFKIQPVGEVYGDVLDNIGFFNLESMANTQAVIANTIVWSIKKLPLQIIYESGVFSTYFPHKEIPHWFTYKTNGSTISFTIPMSSSLEIRGMSLCLVYTCLSDSVLWYSVNAVSVMINNKSNGVEVRYGPRCWGIPEVDNGEMVWLSYWLPEFWENLFEEGNQVEVSFNLNIQGEIKGCGVHPLYFNEEGGGVVHYFSTLRSSWDAGMDIFRCRESLEETKLEGRRIIKDRRIGYRSSANDFHVSL